MSSNDGNRPSLQLPALTPTLHNDHNDPNQVTQYFNLCSEASTFDDLCSQLSKVPLPLRIHVYEALHIHFQLDPNSYFFDISLFGIFFSTFKESSAVVSNHVDTILEQPYFNEFEEQFYLIPLNLRAEVHEALFQKALWSHDQTNRINSLKISTDLYGVDIQLTEADQEANHFQNSLFDAVDEFSFITQFRQIPLQYRSSVYKVLLHTVQQDEQSAEFCDWVSMIRAADLYIDFCDVAQRISEEVHIYANAFFISPSKYGLMQVGFLNIPRAVGGQVCQTICFKALMLPCSCKITAHHLSYLQHKPGPLHQLNKILDAPSYDAFITEFLAIDRSQRIKIHNDLYLFTKSDLVQYKEKFDWVLQCAHPYYFVNGFDDDLESESNQAVKCAHDFIVNPGHRDAIFAQFAQFTEHSSRFKFCLTLASKSSYEWISSHIDLQQYIDPLYPELVSATEEVKECVGRCLLASNLGEFKVAFYSIPFSMRHEVYTSLSLYKDFYHTKQQDFLNALHPLEVIINVNHYISDDELAIYATACSSAQNSTHFQRFLSAVPYAIRPQIYKLTLLLHAKTRHFDTDCTLHSSHLWKLPTRISSTPQVVECLNAGNFDQFKSRFLSVPRESRPEAYTALYSRTQNDRSKFIWLLQCTHPYYFLDGFDDDYDFKSESDAKFSETFLVHFDRDDVYDTFTQLPQSFRFDLFLKLASQVSYTWLTSHTDKLPRYLSCLYPELVSSIEEVKECFGRCLLAPNLGEFKVAFHSIPFAIRHEAHNALSLYKDFYHTKQQDFLNALLPFEVTVDVNHYINDDELAIYATACPTLSHDRNSIDAFFHIIPYSIRAQVYNLMKLKFDFRRALLRLDVKQPLLNSSLWEIKNINTSHSSQINNPNISQSPDSDLVDSCLSADNLDQFKSRFLGIPRESRPQAYQALYVATQNDRSKFTLLLQCTHPSYFLDDFDL